MRGPPLVRRILRRDAPEAVIVARAPEHVCQFGRRLRVVQAVVVVVNRLAWSQNSSTTPATTRTSATLNTGQWGTRMKSNDVPAHQPIGVVSEPARQDQQEGPPRGARPAGTNHGCGQAAIPTAPRPNPEARETSDRR